MRVKESPARIIALAALILAACLNAAPHAFGQEGDTKAPAQEDRPLRLAVAGVTHGHLGEVISRINRGDFTVVGVYEADGRYLADNPLHRFLPEERFYDRLGKMLDETKPEVVVAYGSIKDHLAVVCACAPRHIHVMVEKPLAASARDARKIVKLARRHGIRVLTNYETSWYPANHAAKALVDAGALGSLVRINVYDGHQGPIEIGCDKRFLDWLCDPVLNGGGAVKDFGCYGANLATWLLGGRAPKTVSGILHRNKPDKYPKVDDDATILLDYGDVTVQVMASWCWPFNRKDMYVYGLGGYVHQHTGRQMETLIGKEASGMYEAAPLESPYDDSFRYLKAAVRGEIEVTPGDLASEENNLLVVRILDAAKKSARLGRPVKIR